jgi:hypothetical protein
VGYRWLGTLVCAVGLVAALVGAGRSEAGDGAPGTLHSAVRIRDKATARAVEHALAAARERLAQPACQRVLSDFRDPSGRSLDDVVVGVGGSAQAFRAQLLFYEGSGYPTCVKRGALAFTQPSSRVIFVCGNSFVRAHPLQAQATLIHEMLHAAGLDHEASGRNGTNWAVLRRCSE